MKWINWNGSDNQDVLFDSIKKIRVQYNKRQNMSENYRNSKPAQRLLLNISQNASKNGSSEITGSANKQNYLQLHNLHNNTLPQQQSHLQQQYSFPMTPQTVQLPITYKALSEFETQYLNQFMGQTNSMNIDKQQTQSQKSVIDQQLNQPQIPQLYSRYSNALLLINSINNRNDEQIKQQAIAELHQLYKICINKNIGNQIETNTKNRNRNNQLKDKQQDVQYIILLINLSLNIWKLLTDSVGDDNQIDKGDDNRDSEDQRLGSRSKGKNKEQNVMNTKRHQRNNSYKIVGVADQLVPIDVVGNAVIKILSIFGISSIAILDNKISNQNRTKIMHQDSKNSQNQYSYLQLLPNPSKNRLLLLIIIWAKQYLCSGQAERALQICNICSTMIIPNCKPYTKMIKSGQKSMTKVIPITKQTKFKLHYLRIKIFNKLNLYRQELQQIFICQQILKTIQNNQNNTAKNSNSNSRSKSIHKSKTQSQLNQKNQFVSNKAKNNINITLLSKLQKRKNQIQQQMQNKYHNMQFPKNNGQSSHIENNMNYQVIDNQNTKKKQYFKSVHIHKNKQIISNHQQRSNSANKTRRLKQVRDSLMITHDSGNMINQMIQTNEFNANKIRSFSFSNFNKKYAKTSQITNQVQEDNIDTCNENFMYKNGYQQDQTLTKTKLIVNQNQNSNNSTVNISNNSNQQKMITSLHQSNSISKSKSQSMHKAKSNQLSLHAQNEPTQNNTKIQSKYQLKTKKLAKRPMINNFKNKQYQNVLLSLQIQLNNKNTSNININIHNAGNFAYSQMLAKRPQCQQTSTLNKMKNSQQFLNLYHKDPNNRNTNNLNYQISQNQDNSQNNRTKTYNKSYQNVIKECVSIVQKQVIDKYILKSASMRETQLQKQQQDGINSQNHVCFSQSQDSSDDSNDVGEESKNKEGDSKQCKLCCTMEQKFTKDQAQPPLQVNLNNMIFPGLGKCEAIKVVIQRIKHINQKDKQNQFAFNKQNSIYVMNVNIRCQSGIFWSAHRMPDSLMSSKYIISDNIMKKIDSNLLRIRVGDTFVQTQQQQKIVINQDVLLKKKIIKYLKDRLFISNKGLGLHLQYKKDDKNNYVNLSKLKNSLNQKSQNQIRSINNKVPHTDLFKKMAYFSRVFLQNKKSIQSLFSQQNIFNISSLTQNILIKATSFRANGEPLNESQNKNELIKTQTNSQPFEIMDKLKVLYISIQKKSKKEKKKRKKSKGSVKLSQKHDSKQLIKNQPNINDKQKLGLIQKIQKSRKRCTINQNINTDIQIFRNQQDFIENQQSEKHKNSSQQRIKPIDNLLVPVVKYILLGQTSKPKHKLKTIIIKGGSHIHANINNVSYQSQDQDYEDREKLRLMQKSKCSKYGLLAPFMDDQATVKIRTISTNIYAQIIGKYFMGAGNRRIKEQKLNNQSIIPEDVMLSLKYYLMITNQCSHTIPIQQNRKFKTLNKMDKNKNKKFILNTQQLIFDNAKQNWNHLNIMQKFYDKFQYSFNIKLNKSRQQLQNKKNYHVKVTLFRVKKLYRVGFNKFYLLKFQISERKARTRMDQFIATSYDILRHFNGLELNLSDLIDNLIEQDEYQQQIENKQQESFKQQNTPCQEQLQKQTQSVNNKQFKSINQNNSNHNSITNIKANQLIPNNQNNNNMYLPLLTKKSSFINKDQNSNINIVSNRLNSNDIESADSLESLTALNFGITGKFIKGKMNRQSQQIPQKKVNAASQIHSQVFRKQNTDQSSNKCRIVQQKQQEKSKHSIKEQMQIQRNNREKTNLQIITKTGIKHVKSIKNISNNNANSNDNSGQANNPLAHTNTDSILSNILSNRLSCQQTKHKKLFTSCSNYSNFKSDINGANNFSNELAIQQKGNHTLMINSYNGNFQFGNKTDRINDQQQSCVDNLAAVSNQQLAKSRSELISNKNMNNINTIRTFGKVTIQNKQNKNQSQYNIVQCLKRISQKISIYKTQVYTRIGLEPFNQSIQVFTNRQIQKQQIVYHANKFRYSRNKYQHFPQEFLSPHLKSLQILFQKTIKIQCDNIYAILTVLKVKQCTEFYIKIYVPKSQKTMSFTINHTVFQYFTIDQIKQIFDPYIKFSYAQQNRVEQNKLNLAQEYKKIIPSPKNKNFVHFSEKDICKVQQSQLSYQVDKNDKKQMRYIISKIEQYLSGHSEQEQQQQIQYVTEQIQEAKIIQQKSKMSKSSQKMSLFSEVQKGGQTVNENIKIESQQSLSIKQNTYQQIECSTIKQFKNQTVKSLKNLNQVTKKQPLSMSLKVPNSSHKKCSNQTNKDGTKEIWNRILKHLQFSRRSNTTYVVQQNQQYDTTNYQSYLIAKLGNYEAFIKDFSVQDYVCVPNKDCKQNTNNRNMINAFMNMGMRNSNKGCQIETFNNIIKIQISMQYKFDGLNFLPASKSKNPIKNKLLNKRKKLAIKSSKPKNSGKKSSLISYAPSNKNSRQHERSNIYESQANKRMVYISLSDVKTSQRICYCYYLCELLHLIDYSSTNVNKNGKQKQEDNNHYRIQSKQFNQMILNYAVLFKVLNYVKNQYIIELQNNPKAYLPKLYRDAKVRDKLKETVDKILLKDINNNTKDQDENATKINQIQQDKLENSDIEDNKDTNIFNNLLNNLLANTLNIKSTTKVRDSQKQTDRKNTEQAKSQIQNRVQNAYNLPKITFNSSIANQKQTNLSFLIRKVVARKKYPISCLFYNQTQNKFQMYLSNYKKGTIRQVSIPVNDHPMPFITVINNHKNNKNGDTDTQIQDEYQKNRKYSNFLLAFRNRLLKYHHNMALLTSI